MCALLQDPQLLAEIREDIQQVAFTPDDPTTYSTQLFRHCRKLRSVYHETLRTSATTGSFREVSRPTSLGGKDLEPGTTVLVPYRELLMSKSAFGASAENFKWDRFLRNESLVRSPNFRPFGGGSGNCPGRFIAQGEILTFVSRVLNLFDVEISDRSEKLPRPATNRPSTGMMGPEGGQDLPILATSKIVA